MNNGVEISWHLAEAFVMLQDSRKEEDYALDGRYDSGNDPRTRSGMNEKQIVPYP